MYSVTVVVVVLFVLVTIASAFGVQQLREYVIKRSILDIPNARSSHSVPTPRGGGLLIVTFVLCGLVIYLIALARTGYMPLLAYIVGGGLIAGISWLDDLKTLSSKLRFAVHFIAAILILIALGYWDNVYMPIVGTVSLGWVGAIFTLIWIIGLTNAFNFMDGIDGIAGSQALIAGLGWCGAGLWFDIPLITWWGMLIAASSLGFLRHNWHPAKIFMGDVGSAFLGYSFAVLPLFMNQLAASPVDQQKSFFLGLLLLWPFVIDAFSTFLKRLLRGENVLSAHREHLYQRLIILGRTHDSVAKLYAALAMTGAGLAFWWISAEISFLPLIIVWFSLIVSLFSYVGYKERKT
ncbi:MAG: glycosyltransferase family 4 protein [Candidatus Promineifilaceae bacterium]